MVYNITNIYCLQSSDKSQTTYVPRHDLTNDVNMISTATREKKNANDGYDNKITTMYMYTSLSYCPIALFCSDDGDDKWMIVMMTEPKTSKIEATEIN